MEFSLESRSLSGYKDLVLYVYYSWYPSNPEESDEFMAKVYEGTPDDPIGCKLPLFCCRGTGIDQWQDTLACLDILLCRYRETSIREPLETWLLECQAMQAEAFKLCIKVCDKGISKKISLPSFRFPDPSPFVRLRYPTELVYTAIPTIKSLEIDDKLKGL